MKTALAKMKRDTSVEEYRLIGSFEKLRRRLMREKYMDRLEHPLVYWALPSDRRLPLVFLGKTLKELLATPFEDLLATPGVGQKKIASLLMLLSRVPKCTPADDPALIGPVNGASEEVGDTDNSMFDPSIISEAIWTRWQATVKRHGLESTKLGRVAPSLQALPTVIWHTLVGDYVDLPLAEIRNLRTHGEKRVRAILEVFWTIHEAFSRSACHGYVNVELVPKAVRPIQQWIGAALDAPNLPNVDRLQASFVAPLLDQIHTDAGDKVYQLASERLGTGGKSLSVRQQAQDRDVTRARVYQLLEECANVMAVRWPEGQYLLVPLAERYHRSGGEASLLFRTAIELFFPRTSDSVHLLARSIPWPVTGAMEQAGTAI